MKVLMGHLRLRVHLTVKIGLSGYLKHATLSVNTYKPVDLRTSCRYINEDKIVTSFDLPTILVSLIRTTCNKKTSSGNKLCSS